MNSKMRCLLLCIISFSESFGFPQPKIEFSRQPQYNYHTYYTVPHACASSGGWKWGVKVFFKKGDAANFESDICVDKIGPEMRLKNIDQRIIPSETDSITVKDTRGIVIGDIKGIPSNKNSEWIFLLKQGKISTYTFLPNETSVSFIQKDSSEYLPFSYDNLKSLVVDDEDVAKFIRRRKIIFWTYVGSAIGGFGMMLGGIPSSMKTTRDKMGQPDKTFEPNILFYAGLTTLVAGSLPYLLVDDISNDSIINLYNSKH